MSVQQKKKKKEKKKKHTHKKNNQRHWSRILRLISVIVFPAWQSRFSLLKGSKLLSLFLLLQLNLNTETFNCGSFPSFALSPCEIPFFFNCMLWHVNFVKWVRYFILSSPLYTFMWVYIVLLRCLVLIHRGSCIRLFIVFKCVCLWKDVTKSVW